MAFLTDTTFQGPWPATYRGCLLEVLQRVGLCILQGCHGRTGLIMSLCSCDGGGGDTLHDMADLKLETGGGGKGTRREGCDGNPLFAFVIRNGWALPKSGMHGCKNRL